MISVISIRNPNPSSKSRYILSESGSLPTWMRCWQPDKPRAFVDEVQYRPASYIRPSIYSTAGIIMRNTFGLLAFSLVAIVGPQQAVKNVNKRNLNAWRQNRDRNMGVLEYRDTGWKSPFCTIAHRMCVQLIFDGR